MRKCWRRISMTGASRPGDQILRWKQCPTKTTPSPESSSCIQSMQLTAVCHQQLQAESLCGRNYHQKKNIIKNIYRFSVEGGEEGASVYRSSTVDIYCRHLVKFYRCPMPLRLPAGFPVSQPKSDIGPAKNPNGVCLKMSSSPSLMGNHCPRLYKLKLP